MLEFPHISVHNLHHNAGPTAEMAFTLLLAASKFIIPMDRSLRVHDWTPRYEPNPSVQLAGKTALILGYGAIGQRVATMCRGIGMRVKAIRKFPEKTTSDCPDEIFSPDSLHQLLPEITALILCLPFTEETKGIIGEKELSLISSKTILVNVGRGLTVDEEALFHALKNGNLHAAGLDVWYNYPKEKDLRKNTPPSEYAYHELDNVVMSPHRAGALGETESEQMRMEELAKLLNAVARREQLLNRVDVKLGY
jgi:phosphoglycerate dehydrogenase-like enzyme